MSDSKSVARLIEIALPIREISAESVRDKSLRHGHISTLHIWWARRPLAAANIKTTEDRIDELNGRLERRREELQQERHCTITDIRHHGRAWVLPHPERTAPGIAPMVRDDEIERIAVQAVIAYEEARGWRVKSVEKENRGFDLISRRPHPEDPSQIPARGQTAVEVRFIEVKGRARIGRWRSRRTSTRPPNG